MVTSHNIRVSLIAILLLAASRVGAQEFPIAVGSDSTFSGGAVYGGGNGIVGVCGDALSQYSITAQIVGSGGTLVGSRISFGAFGPPPGAMPLFDGTNYFFVWMDFSGTIRGQLLSTTGTLVGSTFQIATGANLQRMPSAKLALSDTTVLVAFLKSDGYLYGQRVGRSGGLVGNQFQISSGLARDFSMAYDGTNFLVTWVVVIQDTDKDIAGQFVSKSGTLVGGNFVIDNGPNYSDNPTSLCFGGGHYLLAYHEQPPGATRWTMVGRFISTSGALQDSILICDTTKSPGFASAGFDGANFLVSWSQRSTMSLMGQFYTPTGVAIDTPFTIFGPKPNKIPYGGVGFGGGQYLAVVTQLDSTMTNGDVYGRFIQPLTGVEDQPQAIAADFALLPNFPNPFNPSTEIRYQLPVGSEVTLKVFDLLGREVRTLVAQHQRAGTHAVRFDAGNLPSGVYLCRLDAGSYRETRKILLMK